MTKDRAFVVEACLMIALFVGAVAWAPAAAAVSECCDRFGTIVAAGDEDAGEPLFSVFFAGFFTLDDGNGQLDPDEPVILDMQGDWTLSVGDIVLSESGRRVASDHPDLGRPLFGVPGTFAVDQDQDTGAFTVYVDLDPSASVTAGDLRITAVGAEPAGSRVRATDADVGRPLFATGGLSALDLDGNGWIDGSNPVYYGVWGAWTVSPGTTVRLAGVPTDLQAHPAVVDASAPAAPLVLSATLTSDDGTPLRGRTVDFHAGAEKVCTTVTGADGTAICTGSVALVKTVAALGYTAHFVGAGYYHGSSADGGLA